MPAGAVLLCLVIGIADGDTLTARCETPAGMENIKVRLAEVDAPEKGQAFGTQSKQRRWVLFESGPAGPP
jgi:endonuclease YncB( thermonuclease family)